MQKALNAVQSQPTAENILALNHAIELTKEFETMDNMHQVSIG